MDKNALLVRIDPILLRCYKVKKSFRPPIELMQFSILLLHMILRRLLVENREQECTVVKRAVLDSVIQLRDAGRVEFFWFDVAEVFKEFLPAFSEEPRFVAAAPAERKQRSDYGRRVEKRGRGNPRKQMCDGGKYVAEVYDRSRTYHRSWILSTSNNSKFFRIVSRKELSSSITSWIHNEQKSGTSSSKLGNESAHPDNLYRFFLHTLRPRQLRPLLRFSRPQKDLQPLLDIIHQVFGSIRIIEQVLAHDELQWFSWWCGRFRVAVTIVGGSRTWCRIGGIVRWRVVEESGCEYFCGGDHSALGGGENL